MADKERIKRLASTLKKRKDAKELVKKSKKPLFDKEKIADRIPADGGYPGGTSGVVDAVRHYLTNDDNYVGDRIKNAMDDSSLGVLDPVSLSQVLAHEDAKRIYLGMPQVYGSFEPSPYRPTVGTMENPYQVNGLLTDDEFENTILPMYATWKTGKDWPIYDTASRVTDLGRTAQLSDFPYLHRAGMSEGYDDRGQYISLQDTWDYNTAVKGKSGDNVGKWVGGKPFDIYQRYYLDDWLDVPDEAKGNPYIAPSYIEADYTWPRYVPDYTFWGLPQERGEWDPVNGFACGGKKFDVGGDTNPYTGEIRQGKEWNAMDYWLADHPMLRHRLRKVGTLLKDAAMAIPQVGALMSMKDLIENDFTERPDALSNTVGNAILEHVKNATPTTMRKMGQIPDYLTGYNFLGNALYRVPAGINFIRDFAEPVENFACGGKKFDEGGNTSDDGKKKRDPINRFDGGGKYYKVPTPIADGQNATNYVEAQPNYSDGMFGGVDVSGFYDAMGKLRMPLPEVQAAKVEPVRVDTTPEWYNMVPLLYDVPSGFYTGISADTDGGLFSEEAKARRKIKQRWAESKFNDRAESNAGAKGAWQIMPITYKDYLGRGRGEEGDLYDAKFNEKIRDWVMGIIPRDLQEFWSENDSDINKLAKLYAAYNWGAGSLRNFFRKRLNAGLSNDDPYEWVEGLNPETRRYVKYLAFDEDFDDDSGYTTRKFEDAAKARGYMAEGGRLFEDGGPEGDSDGIHLGELQPAVKLAYEPLHVEIPYTTDDFFERWYPNRRAQLIDNMAAIRSRHAAWPFFGKKRAEKDVDGYIRSVLANNSNVKEFGVPIFGAYGSNNKFPNAFNNEEARKVLSDHLESKYRFIGKEIPEGGFDNFDLAFLEMGNAYGKSYKDNPYYIFYDRGNPSFETIVHERSHVLRPLPEDLKKYKDYRYFGNPMERKVDDIKRDLVHTDFWSGKIDKSWANGEGVDKVKDDISYLSSIEEIVARLNAIRAEQNLNPNHVITKEDLDEIRKNADEATRREFLDLYTDEALLRFFNEVADAGEQESLYGNHIGNISASGGKIRIKPENRGKFTALKKRTGHSASWFKAHGTPAQKKMAVFALNAKKWKHGDGGPIDRYSPEQIRTAIARLKEANK